MQAVGRVQEGNLWCQGDKGQGFPQSALLFPKKKKKKKIFFFFSKCNRTIGSRSIGHRVWSMSLKLSEN